MTCATSGGIRGCIAADHDVLASFVTAAALVEQPERLADAGGVAEEDLELPGAAGPLRRLDLVEQRFGVPPAERVTFRDSHRSGIVRRFATLAAGLTGPTAGRARGSAAARSRAARRGSRATDARSTVSTSAATRAGATPREPGPHAPPGSAALAGLMCGIEPAGGGRDGIGRNRPGVAVVLAAGTARWTPGPDRRASGWSAPGSNPTRRSHRTRPLLPPTAAGGSTRASRSSDR